MKYEMIKNTVAFLQSLNNGRQHVAKTSGGTGNILCSGGVAVAQEALCVAYSTVSQGIQDGAASEEAGFQNRTTIQNLQI